MIWLGLTGGIATGKSTVAKILRDLGLPVVDADDLARQVVLPGKSSALDEIIKDFGAEVLGADSLLDRTKLGKIVFGKPDKLKKLEAILHPRIQELRRIEKNRLEAEGAELAFYDVPLLFEKNLQDEFASVVLVYASAEAQRKRLKERNQLSDLEIDQRLAAQIPIDEKLKLADFVIENTGSLMDLKAQVELIISKIRQKFSL